MAQADNALGKYRLIAEIGRGGMADVYLAVVQGPAGFNKLVVLKKTRRELAQDADFLTMFLDEARLAARLNHPNVVQTTEVGQDGDRYFIAMEYLDGQPLNRIRSRLGADFSIGMQVRVLADALLGLHHAHELCDFDGTPLSVVHRDATPQNVFVTYDGLVKLVDFGIAKAVDSSSETAVGVVKGKVTYMAPEQARGDRVDRRADLFAVGVMLWEAVAQRRMWKGMPDLKVLHSLLGGQIPSIRDAAPGAPRKLVAILDRALAPSPADRYQTAQEMHDALLDYLDEAGARGTSARDVGRFVAERFGEDRAKVKGIIETQLRDVRWTGAYPRATAMNLPKIDPGQLVMTPTTGLKQHGTDASVAMTAPIPLSEPPGEQSGKSGSFTNATAALATNATNPSSPSTASKPTRPIALVGVAALASAIVIVAGVRLFDGGGRREGAGTTATATATATAASTGDPGRGKTMGGTVKVTIRVTPPTAKVFVDDALLGAGAFDGHLMWSDQPKKIRLEAPGFATKEETVTFNEDVMLSFALSPTGAPTAGTTGTGEPPKPPPVAQGGYRGRAPVEPPPVASPTPPVVPPTPPSSPTQKPKRTIDTENPYPQ